MEPPGVESNYIVIVLSSADVIPNGLGAHYAIELKRSYTGDCDNLVFMLNLHQSNADNDFFY